MMWLLALLALFALGSGGSPVGEPANHEGLARLRALALEAGLDVDWALFLAVVAHHESGWNNLVGLGDPLKFPPWARPNLKASASAQRAEASAAAAAYERNLERYRGCEHPRSHYTFGSGGWFGLLPANALKAFWGTELQCISPFAVFEPEASVVLATDYARRLRAYEGFKRLSTWRNLNRGWASPSAMGQPRSGTDARFDRALSALGVPRSWGDRNVTALPQGWAADDVYRRLKGAQS
jgi:hypothetical protein